MMNLSRILDSLETIERETQQIRQELTSVYLTESAQISAREFSRKHKFIGDSTLKRYCAKKLVKNNLAYKVDKRWYLNEPKVIAFFTNHPAFSDRIKKINTPKYHGNLCNVRTGKIPLRKTK
jgi:hypothetical protein